MEHPLPQLATLVLQQGLGHGPVLEGKNARVPVEPLAGKDVLQDYEKPQIILCVRSQKRRNPG
jgi:hypothetical protein